MILQLWYYKKNKSLTSFKFQAVDYSLQVTRPLTDNIRCNIGSKIHFTPKGGRFGEDNFFSLSSFMLC